MEKIATWLYVAIMLLLMSAASLVTFVFPGTPVRPFFIMAFLFICPGMAIVRFFRLDYMIMELALILALSIAIDAFVGGVILYAGLWSPVRIFTVLLLFCLLGTLAVLTAPYSRLLVQRVRILFDLRSA